MRSLPQAQTRPALDSEGPAQMNYVAYITDPAAKHTSRIEFVRPINGSREAMDAFLRQALPNMHVVVRPVKSQ